MKLSRTRNHPHSQTSDGSSSSMGTLPATPPPSLCIPCPKTTPFSHMTPPLITQNVPTSTSTDGVSMIGRCTPTISGAANVTTSAGSGVSMIGHCTPTMSGAANVTSSAGSDFSTMDCAPTLSGAADVTTSGVSTMGRCTPTLSAAVDATTSSAAGSARCLLEGQPSSSMDHHNHHHNYHHHHHHHEATPSLIATSPPNIETSPSTIDLAPTISPNLDSESRFDRRRREGATIWSGEEPRSGFETQIDMESTLRGVTSGVADTEHRQHPSRGVTSGSERRQYPSRDVTADSECRQHPSRGVTSGVTDTEHRQHSSRGATSRNTDTERRQHPSRGATSGITDTERRQHPSRGATLGITDMERRQHSSRGVTSEVTDPEHRQPPSRGVRGADSEHRQHSSRGVTSGVTVTEHIYLDYPSTSDWDDDGGANGDEGDVPPSLTPTGGRGTRSGCIHTSVIQHTDPQALVVRETYETWHHPDSLDEHRRAWSSSLHHDGAMSSLFPGLSRSEQTSPHSVVSHVSLEPNSTPSPAPSSSHISLPQTGITSSSANQDSILQQTAPSPPSPSPPSPSLLADHSYSLVNQLTTQTAPGDVRTTEHTYSLASIGALESPPSADHTTRPALRRSHRLSTRLGLYNTANLRLRGQSSSPLVRNATELSVEHPSHASSPSVEVYEGDVAGGIGSHDSSRIHDNSTTTSRRRSRRTPFRISDLLSEHSSGGSQRRDLSSSSPSPSFFWREHHHHLHHLHPLDLDISSPSPSLITPQRGMGRDDDENDDGDMESSEQVDYALAPHSDESMLFPPSSQIPATVSPSLTAPSFDPLAIHSYVPMFLSPRSPPRATRTFHPTFGDVPASAPPESMGDGAPISTSTPAGSLFEGYRQRSVEALHEAEMLNRSLEYIVNRSFARPRPDNMSRYEGLRSRGPASGNRAGPGQSLFGTEREAEHSLFGTATGHSLFGTERNTGTSVMGGNGGDEEMPRPPSLGDLDRRVSEHMLSSRESLYSRRDRRPSRLRLRATGLGTNTSGSGAHSHTTQLGSTPVLSFSVQRSLPGSSSGNGPDFSHQTVNISSGGGGGASGGGVVVGGAGGAPTPYHTVPEPSQSAPEADVIVVDSDTDEVRQAVSRYGCVIQDFFSGGGGGNSWPCPLCKVTPPFSCVLFRHATPLL